MSSYNFEKGNMPACQYTSDEIEKTDDTKILDNHDTIQVRTQVQNQKRKRIDSADPFTEPEAKKAKIKATKQELAAAKLCSLIIGGRKFELSAKEVQQSYTLQTLATADAELEDDDIQRTKTPKNGCNSAIMKAERFTEACGHTAWLFLRNGKMPKLITFDPAGKHDVGQEMENAYELFPDRGEMLAAAQLFDMSLALRSPNLQRAALKWYAKIRVNTWGPNTEYGIKTRMAWAQPGNQKNPEYKYWIDHYAAWLRLLKRYDPAIQSSISELVDAGNNGLPGCATDIPELSQLEPACLYEYYMSDGDPLEVPESIVEFWRE